MQVRICLKPLNFISNVFDLGKHGDRKCIHRKQVGDTLQAQLGIVCLLDLSLPSLDIQTNFQMITQIQF